jgi:aerobic-type carbon monoxide dehydrogenase small subunit (CoxS/CutS family)
VGHTVEADADTLLLWVLRDLIGLTGTKYGCVAGICGACTVLAEDQPVRSCRLPLSRAAGGPFTTIEGSPPLAQDPIRQAWLEEDWRSAVTVSAAFARGRAGSGQRPVPARRPPHPASADQDLT